MSDEIADLKLQLPEAKTDNKFAQVMGELGKINVRLDGLDQSISGIKPTILITGVTMGIAIIAAMVGILTYGQAGFGYGLSSQAMIKATVAEYVQEHSAVPPKL